MAARPWATPQEVKEYTEYAAVQSRADAKLAVDISRAEQYVIAYTNTDFADAATIPSPVKTAVILIAEAYAYNASADTTTGARRVKSETFDDYSYTAENTDINIDDLDVKVLLDPFVVTEARKGVTLRMRKL